VPTAPQRDRVNLRWLIRLRWLACSAQVVMLVMATASGWPVNLPAMTAIVAVVGASNAILQRLAASLEARGGLHGAILVGDTLLLTILLALGGGASNPFSALFLLHVMLAALTATPAWTAGVLTVGAAGWGGLFLLPQSGHAHHMQGHLLGMYVAFLTLGPFIGWTVTRLRGELADAEAREAEALAARARTARLASLATLAAGAAHELATPLGTIAVAAHEMERSLADRDPDAAEDAALIREEVDRCRDVLERLAADAGSGAAEAPTPTRVAEVLADALAHLPPGVAAEVTVRDETGDGLHLLPARRLARALRGLVKNAVEANRAAAQPHAVDVLATRTNDGLRFEVRDRGPGISEDIRPRVGEPFFTTKPAGRGMGLGVFFARSVLQSAGGRLELRAADVGTVAVAELPVRSAS